MNSPISFEHKIQSEDLSQEHWNLLKKISNGYVNDRILSDNPFYDEPEITDFLGNNGLIEVLPNGQVIVTDLGYELLSEN